MCVWASQVAQWVKNMPAVQETQEIWIRFLGQEDPLKEVTEPEHNVCLVIQLCLTLRPFGL